MPIQFLVIEFFNQVVEKIHITIIPDLTVIFVANFYDFYFYSHLLIYSSRNSDSISI